MPFHVLGDDNQIIQVNCSNIEQVILNMQITIEKMTKWLQDSGFTARGGITDNFDEKYDLMMP